jgi:hypothetical protein
MMFLKVLLAVCALFALAQAEGPQRFIQGGGRYRGKQFRVAKGYTSSRPRGYGGIARGRSIGSARSTPYRRSYYYYPYGGYGYGNRRRSRSRGRHKNAITQKTSAVDWLFSTDGVPSFRAQFFNSDKDSKAGFEFRVALLRFIEFEDAYSAVQGTSVLGFDTQDVVGHKFSLVSDTWTELKNSTSKVGAVEVRTTNSSMWRAQNVSDVAYNTTVKLIVRQSASTVKVGSSVIEPNKMKFDVELENFPYTLTGGTGQVKLGLVAIIQSAPAQARRRLAKSDKPNMGEIAIGNDHGDGYGRFVWSTTAQTWGQTASTAVESPILASTLLADDSTLSNIGTNNDPDKKTGESGNLVVFTFDAEKPRKIYWDPSVGLDDQLLEGSGAALRASILMVLASALAALAFMA